MIEGSCALRITVSRFSNYPVGSVSNLSFSDEVMHSQSCGAVAQEPPNKKATGQSSSPIGSVYLVVQRTALILDSKNMGSMVVGDCGRMTFSCNNFDPRISTSSKQYNLHMSSYLMDVIYLHIAANDLIS